VCATDVKAVQFDAPAVRDLCAADPALGYELVWRVFHVLAERLTDTRAKLIAKTAS
jgi:CRP/FNR family transcriptional regulator, cyclic AMP receptor protein